MFDSLQSDFVQPFSVISWQLALLRLGMACVLGGLIGLEREIHDHAAGLRTHILIAMASCLFTLISFDLMGVPVPGADEETLRTDPLRLIEAVTAGVAFLAAGTIITQGARVRGLTTGAGMWMAGAVGLTCGVGNLWLAGMATGLALAVLWLLAGVSSMLNPDNGARTEARKVD
ncbi:MAG: MgtC/SapB family protein [Paracoccaceae bacterium]